MKFISFCILFHSAFPLHWTIFFLSTTTWKFLIFNWLEYVLIVAAYYLRNIFCATITSLTELRLNILCNLLLFGRCLSDSFNKILECSMKNGKFFCREMQNEKRSL